MRRRVVTDTGQVVRPEPATASAHCFQVASKFWTEYGVLERECDGGFQKPQLIPCVVALSSNLLGIDRGLLAEETQRVGELNFMILAGGGVLERRTDVGREHVSTNHPKPVRRGCGGPFLHEVKHSMQTRGHALRGDDPVLAHPAPMH